MRFLNGEPLEITLALIKPDAVEDCRTGMIIHDIENFGDYMIGDVLATTWSPEFAAEFYREHKDRSFFTDLITFMSSGRLYMLTLVGPNAVRNWRNQMGATDPMKAAANSIREMYSRKDGIIMHNAVHGSDSIESAARECNLIRTALRAPSRVRVDGTPMQAPFFGEEAYRLIDRYKGLKWDGNKAKLVST